MPTGIRPPSAAPAYHIGGPAPRSYAESFGQVRQPGHNMGRRDVGRHGKATPGPVVAAIDSDRRQAQGMSRRDVVKAALGGVENAPLFDPQFGGGLDGMVEMGRLGLVGRDVLGDDNDVQGAAQTAPGLGERTIVDVRQDPKAEAPSQPRQGGNRVGEGRPIPDRGGKALADGGLEPNREMLGLRPPGRPPGPRDRVVPGGYAAVRSGPRRSATATRRRRPPAPRHRPMAA